jgi:hypothetical protein
MEWRRCAELLDSVSRSIDAAADKDKKIGGQTGPAMGAAFRRTSTAMGERAALLREGDAALQSAATVIDKAEKAKEAMDKSHPATSDPGSWKRPTGPLTEEDLKAQSRHQQRVNDYQEAYAARERISRQWSQNIDNVFEDSTEVMKKIHGEQEREVPPPWPPVDDKHVPIDPTTGSPQGPRDHHSDPDDTNDPRDPDDTDDPRDPDDTNDPRDPDDNDDDSGDDSHDLPPTHTGHETTPGGPSTGTLGGLAAGVGGGALAAGGLRSGGLLPSSLSSNGVRPIGSTGRIGTSGALGRTGSIAPGSPATRPGAAGAGRGVGGVGTGGSGNRGGRAGSGGRGTGRGGRAGAGGLGAGRGARKKDEEKKQGPRDLFDDGQDWIDDEGAAPDVLT